MFGKIKIIISAHKTAAWIFLIAVIVGGYYGYGKIKGTTTATSYVLSAVEKGTIITSVSGTGQVSALNQIDVKAKSPGDIVLVGVKNGQEVGAGTLLFKLDTANAEKAVRDAQLALDNSRIALEKFKIDQGGTQYSRTADLEKSYGDGLNQISGAFINLANAIDGIYSVLYADTVKGGCTPNICQYGNFIYDIDAQRFFGNLSARAKEDYAAAKSSYDSALIKYHGIRLLEISHEDLKSMLDTTATTLGLTAQAIKSEQNMLDFLVEQIKRPANAGSGVSTVPAQIVTYQSSLDSFSGTINTTIGGVSGSINSIRSQEESLGSAKIGDPLDLANQENLIAQKEATLSDAKDSLAKLYITTPIAGVVAKVSLQKGDSVSTGTSVATMIAHQRIAVVSLNEVDIAKVKVGQKATLTFDAIDGLTITGSVLEIDTLGTVSQGVVTYNVKIGFDTQDERIKPGMSVSAAIITDSKADVLLVPNSAVKSSGGGNYVLVPQDQASATKIIATAGANSSGKNSGISLTPAPHQQTVEIGLANDTATEIVSGLKEGDWVVIQTITGTTTTTSATSSSTQRQGPVGGIRIPSLGGGGRPD